MNKQTFIFKVKADTREEAADMLVQLLDEEYGLIECIPESFEIAMRMPKHFLVSGDEVTIYKPSYELTDSNGNAVVIMKDQELIFNLVDKDGDSIEFEGSSEEAIEWAKKNGIKCKFNPFDYDCHNLTDFIEDILNCE